MTENEAIKILQRDLQIQLENKALPDGIEAIQLAIHALEEVQQYRTIGTLEELQDMKSNYFEALSDWRQYRKIGTLEECRMAVEKQIAKKPTYEGDGYDYCPSCGQKLDLDRDEQPVAFSMGAKLIDNFVNPFEIKAGGNS